jgi:hypothetical protein
VTAHHACKLNCVENIAGSDGDAACEGLETFGRSDECRDRMASFDGLTNDFNADSARGAQDEQVHSSCLLPQIFEMAGPNYL